MYFLDLSGLSNPWDLCDRWNLSDPSHQYS
jgi:hypothetical protein